MNHIIENVTLSWEELQEHRHYLHCTFVGGFEHPQILNCHFEACIFEKQSLWYADIRQTRFERCTFMNVEWDESYLFDTHFVASKGLGNSFRKAILKNMTWHECNLQYTDFSKSKLEQCAYTECQLQESSWMELNYKDLHFNRCQLDRAQFQATMLGNLDFSTSDFTSLYFDWQRIKGLKLRMDQAVLLAEHLGIQITA